MVRHIIEFAERIFAEVGRYRIVAQIDNYVLAFGHKVVGVVVAGGVVVEIVRLYCERGNLN